MNLTGDQRYFLTILRETGFVRPMPRPSGAGAAHPLQSRRRVQAPAQGKKEIHTLPAGKIGAYLAAAEEHGVLPMFYLELTTGIRRGEFVTLLWDDLDLENQTLTISKSAGRINGEVKVTQPKTANSVRTICLLKETMDLLT